MTTTTSYSNAGHFRPLYGSILKRNAGYFGMASVLIFLFYPVQFALEIFKKVHDYQLDQLAVAKALGEPLINVYNLFGYGKNYTGVSVFFFSAIMIVMPIVLALMLNSYMHSKKAADVFHSLPIRRETMLLANAAVGMTMLAVPVVLSNIAIIAMMTAKFGWLPQLVGSQLMDMVGWLGCALAIYAVTTLASVLSGTVFDSLVFSSMMLFSLPAVGGIYIALCGVFLHGFSANNEMMANLLLCSPTFIMVMRMSNAEGGTLISQTRDLFASNMAIAVYLILGVLLLCLAARIYRNRRSELAETTGYVGPLPLATKLVGTLICGILTGLLFYAMNDNNKLIYILWAIIGSMVAYVILEVILSRGFKHLIKSLPIGAAMIAFTVIGSTAIMNGGFGYENRVPKMENVASVSIQGLNSINNFEDGFYNEQTGGWERNTATLSDPQNIQMILDFHADTVTRNMPKNWAALMKAGEREVYEAVTLEYQMKNGTRMARSYQRFSNKTLEKLNALQFAPEFLTQKDQAFTTPVANITEWKVSNSFGSAMERPTLTVEESARLLEAMQADILARTPETIVAQPVAWVSWTMEYDLGRDARGANTKRSSNGYFNVLTTDLKTLEFLQQKTLLDAIQPDWGKCTAVSLSMDGRYSKGNSGMFRRVRPENLVLSQERESIENSMRYHEEEMTRETTTEMMENDVYTQRYYGDAFLLETRAEIDAVKNSIIGVGRQDQRLVQAVFFFETSDKGLPVTVDYDALPEAIKAKCLEMWGEHFMDNM